MIYIKKFALIVLIFLFVHPIVNAQVKFSLGPSLGITIPTGDYSGTTLDYYAGTKYGLSSGINFGAVFKAKFPILSLKVSLNYSPLKNTGNSEPGQGSVEVKQNLFIIGIGPEFSFNIPASPIKPYVGIDLLLTSFSGETTFQGVARVPSGTYSIASATRTGLGLGAGAEFSFGKKYALDFGIKYSLLNLMGKDFTGGSDRINSYTSLNDASDPLYTASNDEHFIVSNRSISVLQFNLAFLFGF